MWLYDGRIFTSADVGDYMGFVYVLSDRVNHKKYVGKKQFFSTRTLPPLAGTTRKRKRVTESDWHSHCSSSPVIKALVEEHSIHRFQEIVHLCRTKSERATT